MIARKSADTWHFVMQTRHAEDPVELIAAVAQGDRIAIERLYDRFASLVFSVALRILRIQADAEDVVQDVFLQVWNRAETYRSDRGSVESWLLTITRNRALDKRRAANTMKKGLAQIRSVASDSVTETVSGQIVREEVSVGVRSALNRLPDEQRRVLELVYFDGLTQSMIAAHLGEPLGTIKTRIRLGLERLRRLVGEVEAHEGSP
jgi:RNA polymerase sigma-70 factor (ECF subfamily)